MKKIITFSLAAFSFLGLLKIFSIIPFNRMAADDFSVAIETKVSIWKSLTTTFNGGNGRFAATFLQTVFVLMTGDSGKIFFYSLITFGLLLFALLIFFKNLLRTNYRNLYIYLLSSASFAALYMLSPNKSESWYWLTGSATYLWPIILFLFSASFLFDNKLTKGKYIINSILVFASVACNETFGLTVVTVLFMFFLISWFSKKRNNLVLAMLASSLLSFGIMYMAPGNNVRIQGAGSNPMSLGGSILYSIQEGPRHLFSMVLGNLNIILPLLIVFTYVFFKTSITLRGKDMGEAALPKIFWILTAPVALSIVYMLPAFKILGRLQPDRSDTTLAFIILMSLVGTAFYLPDLFKIENFERRMLFKLVVFSGALALFIASFSFTSTLAGDIFIAKYYSQGYDSMINEFKAAHARGDERGIVVSLPYPGLIAATLDPPGRYDYKNLALSQFYGVGQIISK